MMAPPVIFLTKWDYGESPPPHPGELTPGEFSLGCSVPEESIKKIYSVQIYAKYLSIRSIRCCIDLFSMDFARKTHFCPNSDRKFHL